MKHFLTLLLILLSLSCFSQKKQTTSFGINTYCPLLKRDYSDDKPHFDSYFTYGVNFSFSKNYYLNKNSIFSGSISAGYAYIAEIITIPAQKYNLEFDYWNRMNYYIPNISFGFNYSNIFIQNNNYGLFYSVGTGLSSAIWFNESSEHSMKDIDTVFLSKNKYNFIPTPFFNLEFGIKKQLKNDKFINISIDSRYSFFNKYTVNKEFFPSISDFSSNTKLNTNLSYIGFKFSCEF